MSTPAAFLCRYTIIIFFKSDNDNLKKTNTINTPKMQ